jgi:hypothetical protein
MVEKHIFLAESPSSEEEGSSMDTTQVKIKMVFTGVVISDRGRYALIEEKIHKEKGKKKKIYAMGDTISGYRIKRIEPNYIVLSQGDRSIKLKLYGSVKNRPAYIGAPGATAQAGTGSSNGNQPANARNAVRNNTVPGKGAVPGQKNNGSGTAKPVTPPAPKAAVSNAFADAIRKAVEKAKSGNAPQKSNPFLDIVKKARQKGNQ